MLDKIALLSFAKRQNIFNMAAYALGIAEPSIVEKDFWVSWTLEKLFQTQIGEPAPIFKGGTSLSKAYNFIDRFSEDIDITLTRKDLGFNKPDEEVIALGDKKRKAYFNELLNATTTVIANQFLPRLQKSITTLQDPCDMTLDPSNKEIIIFNYPSCFAAKADQYIKSRIILEIGSRGDIFPTENIKITSYVEKALPNLIMESPVIKVLKPERTFWEKIFILHKLAHQSELKPAQDRVSRHYYDVIMLARKKIIDSATKEIKLLDDVALHNMAYFRSKQASYETAKPGSFKLIPDKNYLKALSDDYDRMKSMFTGEILKFENILEEISQIEIALNSIG